MIVFILWGLPSMRNGTLVLLRFTQRRESAGSENLVDNLPAVPHL